MKLCGDVFFDRLTDAGASTGLVSLSYAKLFSITESAETQNRISKARATRGQAVATVQDKQPAEIAVEFDEIRPTVLATALMGADETVSQSSSTVSDEEVTIKHGIAVPLAKGAIAASGFVVKSTDGETTYIEGTDYIVERTVGLITGLSTGSIANNTAVDVSYSAGAFTGTRIKGGAKPTCKARILLIGRDLETNDDVIVDVDCAMLAPTSEIDFMSDEFISAALGGQLITLPGKTQPYTVTIRKAAT